MKKILLILILISFYSCTNFSKKGIKIEIKNNSSQPVKNIIFYTTEKNEILNFTKISRNENIKAFLDMKKNKSDGEYILEFTRENKTKEIIHVGYYSNGIPFNNSIQFIIGDKTVIKNLE